jgi:hypothetical protein
MRFPIIADNEGDLMLFDGLVEAERYLEPIDVLEGGWLEAVRISDPLKITNRQEELSEKLRGYLARNWPEVNLENKALPELIDAVRPYIKER